MWPSIFCCYEPDQDDDEWMATEWTELSPTELVKLARSRLDFLLNAQPKDILCKLKAVRDLLVTVEERGEEKALEKPQRPSETRDSTDHQMQKKIRMSYSSRSRASTKMNDEMMELFADDSNSVDDASKKWIRDTYFNLDTGAANVSSSMAALREQEAMKVEVGSKEMSSRIATLNIRGLDDALKAQDVVQELRHVRTLEFDSVTFAELPAIDNHPLCPLIAHMVTSKGLVWALSESGRVPNETQFRGHFFRFFEQIDLLYKNVPYHGVAHAADVLNITGWLFVSEYFLKQMSALERVVGLAAAAVHDVAHPGFTNSFLEKSRSELALRYNDKSILENMHVSLGFETMKKHKDCDWYSLLPQKYVDPEDPSLTEVDLQHYARKLMIEMVLATDMAHHANCVIETVSFAEEQTDEMFASQGTNKSQQADKLLNLDRKLFMMKTALHAADISNPSRPRDIMLKWTDRIQTEFWAQGDKEKELGRTVSPLCDRVVGIETVAKGQLGFINFVVRPLLSPLAVIIPEVSEAVKMLDENEKFWQDMDKTQASYKEIFASVKTIKP